MIADLAASIRNAIIGQSAIVAQLSAYAGGYPVFTRRPVPDGAPYPMVVVSPDVTATDLDGINDYRPVQIRDVAVYGHNDLPASYRQVETIARAVRELFHRQQDSMTVSGWTVTQIVASGPRAAPVDDEKTVGRVVELTIHLYRKP